MLDMKKPKTCIIYSSKCLTCVITPTPLFFIAFLTDRNEYTVSYHGERGLWRNCRMDSESDILFFQQPERGNVSM